MPKEIGPHEGLADDAVLATDLGDEEARRTEQLSYYGGDGEDDDVDPDADRGDNITVEAEDEDRGDDVKPEEKPDDAEKDADGTEEEDSDDDSEPDDDSDVDADDTGDESSEDGDPDDADVDEEEAEEDEEEDEEEAPKKEKGIPRHRFNEVNTRMRTAEAELATLKAQQTASEDAAVEKFDFDAAEEEYMTLLLDGKTKDAGAKRSEIRAAEKAEFKAEAVADATTSVNESTTDKAVDALSREAEGMFPAFDSKSDDFNPAAVSKTITFMRAYRAEGMSGDDAFVAALADVIELYHLDTESLDDEVPKKKTGKTVTKKAPIKKTKEKIAASKQQGRSPAGEGKGSSEAGAVVPDIDQLSEEELDALPAETLSRMRGDFM